jgi:hypothetical protein
MQAYQMPVPRVKLIGIFIVCFFILNHVYGQEPGKVEVFKDPQIDSLIARRIVISNIKGNDISPGFQVQIYLGSDRQEAYDAQNRFKSLHPEVNAYISYTEPNYKVQVGDFHARSDAQRLINELKQYFPILLIIPATVQSK